MGVIGCEIAFWPVICVPLVKPAAIWRVWFVFMAGRTDVEDGTEQMLERR